MKATLDDQQRLLRMERLLAGFLRYGAIVASGWIAIGMVLAMLGDPSPAQSGATSLSDACLTTGIVLLIALPVLRVALTTMVFLFEQDYLFAAISAAVLLIITLGFILGVVSPTSHFL